MNTVYQGLLPPKMTTIARKAISSPAIGLTVYDTDLKQLTVFTGNGGTTGWALVTAVQE